MGATTSGRRDSARNRAAPSVTAAGNAARDDAGGEAVWHTRTLTQHGHRPLRWAPRGPRPRRDAAQHRCGPPVPSRARRRRGAGPAARHGPLRAERRQPAGLARHRRQGPRRPRRAARPLPERLVRVPGHGGGRTGALGAGDRPGRRGRSHRRRGAASPRPARAAPGFAETLDTAPALLLVLADLSALAAVDRDLPRYTFAGGASIYPFVWSLLLAARTEGLGGVMTTMPVRQEDEVRALFGIPADRGRGRPRRPGPPRDGAHAACAARRCGSFAWVDRFEGTPIAGP